MNVPGHNPAPEALVTQILKQITNLNRQLPPPGSPISDPAQSRPVGAPVSDPAQFEFMSRPDRRSSGPTPTPPAEGGEGWESETVSGCAPAEPDFGLRLQQRMLDMGILPAFARHVLEYLQTSDREGRAESPQDELLYLRALLRSWWRPAPAPQTASCTQAHVFVGPGGAGKTTVLSKWLAQAVLLGGQSACVWRLDGCTANTAEALTVYAEILGVPIARAWTGDLTLLS